MAAYHKGLGSLVWSTDCHLIRDYKPLSRGIITHLAQSFCGAWWVPLLKEIAIARQLFFVKTNNLKG